MIRSLDGPPLVSPPRAAGARLLPAAICCVGLLLPPPALAQTATALPEAATVLPEAATALPEAVEAAGAGSARAVSEPSDLAETVHVFREDRAALLRRHSLDSPRRRARMRDFYDGWAAHLDALDFEGLNVEGKIDWVLLRNRIRYEIDRLAVDADLEAELAPLLPFHDELVRLHERRRDLEPMGPREAAEVLDRVARSVADARSAVERAAGDDREGVEDAREGAAAGPGRTPAAAATLGATAAATAAMPTPVVAMRAVSRLDALRGATRDWFEHFDAYDPLFSWWVRAPWDALEEALREYAGFLRREVAGIRPGEEEPVIGDPLGREALLLDLRNEMIAYTPEELMELAERELAWGTARLREASREMGFGDDWHAALEHVKGLHVEPGEQVRLVTELAREAEAFIESRNLVTVPPLAKEVWRMEMLSPERQRIAPFFLGGEVVRVAFPTDGMTHEEKVMSLRANNEHFSRAVVHHELIPGHHLQGFMTSRYSTHRSLFSTPFWGEGWALYWELLLWDLDFPRGPEDRIGMLVWRNHRAARILFSLSFHLELMTPEEAVELLVERVGFERAASEAEVRRSFTGQYSPLYQAGYLLGGLQLRQLHRELVESGRMSNRDFHDHILRGGRMPIEMVRASILGEAPARDFEASWRFYPLEER